MVAAVRAPRGVVDREVQGGDADLLSRAYTTASCAHVAACLGVSVEEAAAQGVGMGWSLAEDGMFGVVRRKVDDEAEALGMDAVEKLPALMVHATDIAGPDEDED